MPNNYKSASKYPVRKAIAVASLLLAGSAEAQQARELLKPVNPTHTARLEDYNSTFLRSQTYFASRYRIVEVNDALLLQARDIVVTPFDDVQPIKLSPLPGTPEHNGDDIVYWKGSYQAFEGVRSQFERLGIPLPTVTISRFAWDLDQSGNAEASYLNRFEFSPRWAIDDAGNAVLEKRAGDDSAVVGPPPQTPEQIERHKRLKTLNKQALVSVDATFEAPDGSKYVLMHLQYTPKYSVIYEIRPDTVIPIRMDFTPGDPDLSPAEKEVHERYRAFLEALPKEKDKPLRGDAP